MKKFRLLLAKYRRRDEALNEAEQMVLDAEDRLKLANEHLEASKRNAKELKKLVRRNHFSEALYQAFGGTP